MSTKKQRAIDWCHRHNQSVLFCSTGQVIMHHMASQAKRETIEDAVEEILEKQITYWGNINCSSSAGYIKKYKRDLEILKGGTMTESILAELLFKGYRVVDLARTGSRNFHISASKISNHRPEAIHGNGDSLAAAVADLSKNIREIEDEDRG